MFIHLMYFNNSGKISRYKDCHLEDNRSRAEKLLLSINRGSIKLVFLMKPQVQNLVMCG